ncbi:MAG: acetolactate synthase small subunit [Pseudomonadota bacterium]
MRHVISVLMQNEVGALTRFTGLFSTRGYNIETLNVAPTDDPGVSRLTMVVTGSDHAIGQITNQIGKLVDVVNIHDMTLGEHYESEMLILKLRLGIGGVARAQTLASEYGATVLDAEPESFTMQLIGSPADLKKLVETAKDVGEIAAVARSGSVAVSRGIVSLSSYDVNRRLTG